MSPSAGTNDARPARRSRRAVRAPGTVGTDDTLLRSTLPALDDGGAKPIGTPATLEAAGPTNPSPAGAATDPAVTDPAATGAAALLNRSADDSDVGWGERADSNDDRLRQDKPPHW